MTDEVARARVVACARSWIDTPFVNLARVKGVGIDCAQLLAAVATEAGLFPHIETDYYAPQHMLHDRSERMAPIVLRFTREITEAQVGPGDVVLYKVAHSFSHAAIVVDWPREIIHAHSLSRKVISMPAFAYDMAGRETRFFSFWAD